MGRKIDQGTDKAAVVGKALRSLFRKLERRPVPDAIRTVVDQLEATDEPGTKAESA